MQLLACAEVLARVHQPEIEMLADMDAFYEAAAKRAPVDAAPWAGWLQESHARYVRYTDPPARDAKPDPALRVTVVFIVFNNGMYGTIRTHQKIHHPGRPITTDLSSPDLVLNTQPAGLKAKRRETTNFSPALTRALASGRGYLIGLVIEVQILPPRASLTDLRQVAQQGFG